MRRTIPILSAATAALALAAVASCTTTAGADETPSPHASITAAPLSNCGGITVDWIAPDTADVTMWRANVTPAPDGAEPAPEWVLVDVEPVRVIDYPTPHGDTYLYRLDVDTDRVEPGPEISIMSDRVTSFACTTPTPDVTADPTEAPSTPSTSPTPSPSPSSSADPSPSASAGSAAPSSPAPETKDSEGGLAATGSDGGNR